jgi:hypothetical protein
MGMRCRGRVCGNTWELYEELCTADRWFVKASKERKESGRRTEAYFDTLPSPSLRATHLHQVSVNRYSWRTDYIRMHCWNFWFRQVK